MVSCRTKESPANLLQGFTLAAGPRPPRAAHLVDARSCFASWGALGKVQQLDQRYPWLREKATPSLPPATIAHPSSSWMSGRMVKARRRSGEIVLDELVKTLLRIAVEHASAGRGCLSCSPTTSHGSRRKRRPARPC